MNTTHAVPGLLIAVSWHLSSEGLTHSGYAAQETERVRAESAVGAPTRKQCISLGGMRTCRDGTSYAGP